MNPKRSNRTIAQILIILGVVGSLMIANILFTMITQTHLRSNTNILQFRKGDDIKQSVIQASRGYIRDKNGEIIAQDIDSYTIYAILDENRKGINDEPAYVVNLEDTAIALAPKLDMDAAEILEYLKTGKQNNAYQTEFGLKGKQLSASVKESIVALGLPGIEFTKNVQRVYPSSKFASHLIGFATYDETQNRIVGKMGVEEVLDEYLVGTNGKEVYAQDANGNILPGTKHIEEPAVNGNDVYLTIDKNIQLALENALSYTMNNFNATKAWGVIMEVETGKILGWSSYPTFDLNERDIQDYVNIPSAYQFEPGSVMKAFTYAAAVDQGVYPYDKTFYADKFHVGYDAEADKIVRLWQKDNSIGTINDAESKNYGTISFDEGFMRSSNVAICELLANYLNPSVFEEYLDRFGFFKAVGTYGLNEGIGVKNFTYPMEKLATGFGQGSSVTTLQLMQAYSAIFNDGKMVKPYYIDRIVNANNGQVVKQFESEVVGQPISEETSKFMRTLMQSVVENEIGTANYRYYMEDVSMIAKTGTAEIAQNGVYGKSYYLNSVMAAAPAEDPKIMVYYAFESTDIKLFSGDPFKQVMKEALVAMNLAKNESLESNQVTYNEFKEYEMPSLINHSNEYVVEKLRDYNVNRVVIGDGKSIIKQFPEAGTTIQTGQNIFLVTDGASITMPNMSGWTRKDVITFWNLTGIAIRMEGFGSVKTQSVREGEAIDKYTEIVVTLE
ncbi:MAG: penicillin-binding protein [Erysipelotrichaceae bacterium]|nr:penicillin-binding protein [Erysipelotrichaceae bacterium]